MSLLVLAVYWVTVPTCLFEGKKSSLPALLLSQTTCSQFGTPMLQSHSSLDLESVSLQHANFKLYTSLKDTEDAQ